MPHLVLEHSAPLAEGHDLQALCQTLFDRLAQMPEIPNPSSIKIRTQPSPAWVIGTEPQSFLHATLHALPGRTDAQKSTLTGAILDTLQTALPDVGSLSVNYSELSAAYAKRTL